MSSNNIDYFDDNFQSIDLGENYNLESIVNDETISFSQVDEILNLNDVEIIPIPRVKYNPYTMSHQELKEYHIQLALNKKKYIRKYQKTDKGKSKIKVASKKYYDKNRKNILEKKRLAYAQKKKNNN